MFSKMHPEFFQPRVQKHYKLHKYTLYGVKNVWFGEHAEYCFSHYIYVNYTPFLFIQYSIIYSS